ncbi:MAG: beta-propeller domain-containing protein, partial [Acidimicrobiales bacterium]
GEFGFRLADGDLAVEEAFADDGASADVAASAAESEPTAGGFQSGGTGGEDFIGTNVQELGVDEPDIIKTDGDRILVVSENRLTYVDVSNGDATKLDTLTIPEGWGHELFFEGDRAFLFTNGGSWGFPGPMPVDALTIEEDAITQDAEAEFAAESTIAEEFGPVWYGPSATIVEVDLSDPSSLEIVSTLEIQGQYLSARRVGETVRMALTSPPTQLEWVYPSSPAGEDRAERFNRELIDETTIEDWIPEYQITTADGATGGPLLACDRLHRPAEFSGFDVVSVLSFGLEDGLDRGDGAGVLASGQTVYSSTDRFYIATTEWAGEEIVEGDLVRWNENFTTDVHAFAIATDEPAEYVASGMVEGSLLNQFSMDEHEGYLRVITTEGSPWDERNKSETNLVVMEERGDVLTIVGSVGGLGKGETLYSARLMDDVGFAVTFRQIDPFYVLDLSDPENPTVSGELKIPGFSTYLHPIGDDLVLGVGQNATEEGRTLGLKVSLFSVSDPSNPTEVATWTMDDANSPVEWDHRSFQFITDTRTAIIPVQSHSGNTGAVLLRIGDNTIDEVGRVTHEKTDSAPTSDCDVVDPELFGEDTEMFWIASEGGRVQACDENDNGGYGSWHCDVIAVEDLQHFGAEGTMDSAITELFGSDPGPEDRVEICWPDGGNWRLQIQRSLVIGDDLWTMSPAQLQANDLDELNVGAIISL